jgi:hypothetical protein
MYRWPKANRAKTLDVKPFGEIRQEVIVNKLASFFAASPHAA